MVILFRLLMIFLLNQLNNILIAVLRTGSVHQKTLFLTEETIEGRTFAPNPAKRH